MSTIPVPADLPKERRDLSLWLAVLGAPTLFLWHPQTNYALVDWACFTHKRWVLPVVSAVYLAAILAGGITSWAELHRSCGSTTEPGVIVPVARHRTLAILGVMSAGLFFLLVLAQAIATFILAPCAE